jgi:acyl-CoA hydrolase
MENKRIKDSIVTMTEIVLPNDTNPLGILLGGRLLYWMDIAAAICAQNHAEHIAVTASIDNISFSFPIKIGDIVHMKAQITRVFNTSLEIYVEVWKKEISSKKKLKTNEAYFTFVALDNNGRPISVDQVFPESEKTQLLYDSAIERRKNRIAHYKN